MTEKNFWSSAANPETGDKFERFLEYIRVAHNGDMDVGSFIRSEYGQAFARILDLRFRLEEDLKSPQAGEFCRNHHIRLEMNDDYDYYSRWLMVIPEGTKPEKRYPLIIANHGGGNAIETDAFCFGLPQIAGREGFMALYPQNTNEDNIRRLLDLACEKYPVDRERVYLMGYSQGGYQVTSALFRMPELLAGAAPCGNDIFRDWDNFNIPYTKEEFRNVKKAMVPVFQMVGACEASSFVPVNDWKPRKDWGYSVSGEPWENPRKNDLLDPTRIRGGRRPFSNMPTPPEDKDRHQWMIERLNKRMDSLNCESRDMGQCISYLNSPEDEFHHLLGFYGDREHVELHWGYRHYIADIHNREGLEVFRYVVVENSPHWPPVMMGQMAWDFFKRFRRDQVTGKLSEDPYQTEEFTL